MVSGFKTSPWDQDKISSGEASFIWSPAKSTIFFIYLLSFFTGSTTTSSVGAGEEVSSVTGATVSSATTGVGATTSGSSAITGPVGIMERQREFNSLTKTLKDSGTVLSGMGRPLTMASKAFERPTTPSDLMVSISCKVWAALWASRAQTS